MNINIKLEKFRENDFVHYFQLVSDEKVMELITERAIGIEEAKTDFDKIVENNKISEHFGNFKIIDTSTNEFIGLAKLEVKSQNNSDAELGYMISPRFWGKGIASRVAKQLIETAKKQETLDKLFAIIDPKNQPSRKILTNNGFQSKEFIDFDGLPGEVLELNINKNN